jgi:hypothetical protein
LAKQHSSSSSHLEAQASAAVSAVPQLLLLLAGAYSVLLGVVMVLLGRGAVLPTARSLAKQRQRVAVAGVVLGLAAVRHQLGVVGLGSALLQLVVVPRRCLELQQVVALVVLVMIGSQEASL